MLVSPAAVLCLLLPWPGNAMSKHPSSYERGQAAILLTLSMVVTIGLLGMVADIGWAYWRREAATTAADSAALAAAMYAKTTSAFTAQSDTACSASPASPPTSPAGAGCLYAK